MSLQIRATGSIVALALILAGCGGGGSSGGSAFVPKTNPGSSSAKTISLGSMSANPLSISQSRSLSPSESGYTGNFTVSSSNPSVLTISPASGPGPFTLTAVGNGTTTITVTDANGNSTKETISVSPIAFGSFVTSPLDLGSSRTLAPTEAGYAGTFFALSSNPSVISISPGSGSGPFTLDGLSAGSATITIADTAGHSASVFMTVAALTTAPTATPTPGSPVTAPSDAPSGSPTTAPSGSPTVSPTTTPSAVPTDTPTAMPTAHPTATPTPPPSIVFSPNTVSAGAFGKTDVTISTAGGTTVSLSAAPNPAIATVVKTGWNAYSIITSGTGGTTSATFSDGTHAATLSIASSGALPRIHPNPIGLGLGVIGLGASVLTLEPTSDDAVCPNLYDLAPQSKAIVSAIVPSPVAVPVVGTNPSPCTVAYPYVVTTAATGSTYISIGDGTSTTYVGFTVGL